MPAPTRDRSDAVEAAILAAISRGDYGPGDRLPSVGELAAQTGTNKNTVSKAIQHLKSIGVLAGPAGGYTRVRVPPVRITRTQPEGYLTEKARAVLDEVERRKSGGSERVTGLDTNSLVFHADYKTVKADGEFALLFGVKRGRKLLVRHYITRATSGEVVGNSRSVLLHSLVAKNSKLLDPAHEPWPGGTLNQLRTVGIEVARIEERITARPPVPGEAHALDLEPGVSVLVFRKLLYSTTGSLVEVADFALPGDRTELVYSFDLPRWDE